MLPNFTKNLLSSRAAIHCFKSHYKYKLGKQQILNVNSRFISSSPVRNSQESEDAAAKDLVKREDLNFGASVLTLNHPEKRNALSLAMLTKIGDSVVEAYKSESTKVIILKSEGKVFSAGHDLRELVADRGSEFHREIFSRCTELMKLVQDIPVPVIAQVSGLATAAGCQLVASCDIAVAAESAKFATPGVHIGLFCSTPAVAVGRAVPRKVAMEMLFTGEPISSQEALLYGLVSRVTPDEKLEATTLSLAEKICSKSRAVISLGKTTFNRQMGENRDQAYCIATDTMVENAELVDCQEGIAAFVEKRKPTWSHDFMKVKVK